MSSLLEQVLDNKDNPSVHDSLNPVDDTAHKLKDGTVVYDSTIAAINRVFEMNPNLYKLITPKGEKLFIGHKQIKIETPTDVSRLVYGDWAPKTDWQLVFFKQKVMELAPKLSFDDYAVSDYLIWDRETATLKRINEDDNIRTIV